MSIERHSVADRAQWLALRGNDVTASTAAALLGVHDYLTFFELWALKTGRLAEDAEASPAMERGRLLEPVAVQILRERHPDWTITHNDGAGRVYLRDPSIRLGATVDVFATDASGTPIVVQIKSVEGSVFRRKWMQDGEAVPPLGVAVQTITEAHLAGAARALVTPLVVGFGLEMPEIDVPIHAGILARIRTEVEAFWRLVDHDETPSPDYAKDADTIAAMYAQDDGETIDLRGDNELPAILDEREAISAAKSEGDKRSKAIKAEIIAKMGSAAYARLADGRLISAKTINRNGYTVAPASYRDVRVLAARRSREEAA